jgi:hypothetical protein
MSSRGKACTLLALAVVLEGCDLFDSSSGNHDSTEPPITPSDLLVYRSDPAPSLLYKLDSEGASTLLSDTAGTQSVDSTYAVSPDARLVAYSYQLEGGMTALAIKRLEDNAAQQPELVARSDLYTPIQWLPDSRGLVYSTFSSEAFASGLFMAVVGESAPLELIGSSLGAQARMEVELSPDGSRLALLAEYFTGLDDLVPESAALYLLELGDTPTTALLATAEGDANTFKLAWSPDGSVLAWQRRYRSEALAPGIPNNRPVGPLMLADAAGDSQVLGDIDGDTGWVPWTWLGPAMILVTDLDRGFEVIGTDGGLVTSHTTSGNRKVVVSPDNHHLAFLDRNPSGRGTAVHALDLRSGVYSVLGPASSELIFSGVFEDSRLRWSPAGAYLAWNVKPSSFLEHWENLTGELYVHDFGAHLTRQVSAELALHEQQYPSDDFFTWLPDSVALDYLAHTATGYELVVMDMSPGLMQIVGEVATVACRVERAWHNDSQILWNACGEGVYLSSRQHDGTFTATQVLDDDIRRMVVTGNRALAVMQPAAVSDDNTDAAWQAYDFSRGHLQELQGTTGTTCCGLLLQ